MKEFATKYFGVLTYSEDSRLHFPSGLPGFEHEHWFVLVHQEQLRPMGFLQSLTRPDLCFLTLPVRAVDPQYRLRIGADDLQALGLAEDREPVIGAEVLCLAILSVVPDGPPTVNMLSPVVVNLNTRECLQSIQIEGGYSIRTPLVEAPREVLC